MEENKHCADGSCASERTNRPKCACGFVPFLAGAVVALAFGWWIFPDMLFSKEAQPVYFSHSIHLDKAGVSCTDCHSLRNDGSFTGLPKLANCTGCHADVLTAEPDAKSTAAEKAAYTAEKNFVENYVKTGKEVSWKLHQKQPDNVFFSHATHFEKCYTCHLTMKGRLNLGKPDDPQKLCMTCHPSLKELDTGIPVERNVLTGYSRTTMKMWQCEQCHAHPGHFYNDGKGRTAANNACYTCHK